MIKVRDEKYLFVFLMDYYRSVVDDIRGGYIYLTCDNEYWEQIKRSFCYHLQKKRLQSLD